MCGRFRLPDDDNFDRELMWIVKKMQQRYPEVTTKFGDIYPTDTVPALTLQEDGIQPFPIKWGFTNSRNSRVMINARAETVPYKVTFKDSFINRRCIISCSGFYEWSAAKDKYFYAHENKGTLYMAGIYNIFGGEPRFLIITTEANMSVSPVHHRMPVVLDKTDIKNWIYDTNAAVQILNRTPDLLKSEICV